MGGFLGSVASGFLINWVTNLAWDKKIKRDDGKIINTMRIQISDYNRMFDNTELDTLAFQKFIENSKVVSLIYTRIFETYAIDSEPLGDFVNRIAEFALNEVNQHYQKIHRNKIKNEDIFYEYFTDLVDLLIVSRQDLLSLESSVQTSIIIEEIRESKDELRKIMIEEVGKIREDNSFADEKIQQIKNMIDSYKFDEADKELSLVFEMQHLLSKLQREEVYYQKARININVYNFENLCDIKNKIARLNDNSKFISEIDFHIACDTKDRTQFNEVICRLQKHRYSREQLTLKEIYFEINHENFEKVKELLLEGDQIKIELREHHDAYFYFGHVLLRKGDFQGAFIEFSKAWDIHKNIIYMYNALVSKYFEIMNNKENYIKRSIEFLNEVEQIVTQLIKMLYITESFKEEDHINYWVVVTNLTVIIDPREALTKLEYINDSIKENKRIQSLIAYVYNSNKMHVEAKSILLNLWDFSPSNTDQFFQILDIEQDWYSIIERSESISSEEYTSHPNIQVLILKAKYKLFGYDTVDKDIIPLVEKYLDAVFLIKELLIIVLENNDNAKFENILGIIREVKSTLLDIEVDYLSKVLLDFKKIFEARELLVDRIEFHEGVLSKYFMSFGDLEEDIQVTSVIYEELKVLYDKGIRFRILLKYKVDIEIILRNWRKAIQTLEEYKEIFGIDDYYAYYMVFSKINKQEFNHLEEEVDYLLRSKEPSSHFLVASLKASQEMWEDAQVIALNTLYLSFENMHKEILMNYISLHFSNIDKETHEVNLDFAIINSVVYLRKDDSFRKIAIHRNKDRIKKSGENKYECENFSHDDPISLILLSEGKLGEEIELLDGKYIIVEILNIYTYFFRYCLEKIQNVYPEHGYFISHSAATTEESIVQLKETMKVMNEDKHRQLEMYNFGVETGLPISYLSGQSIESYAEMILSILNHEDQHLYVGEVSLYEGAEYVLSFSSLILIANFGLLNKLEMISSKCYVPPEVIKSAEIGMRESQKHTKISPGVVMLDEENRISAYSYTEEDKIARRRLWTSLRVVLTKLNVEDVNIDDLDMYDVISKFTLDVDIASLELSKKSKRILVCDDLFIRRIHHTVTDSNNTTNFIGFLISESLVTYGELIDIILKLMEAKYLYPINSDILILISKFIISINDDEDKKNYFEKLREVYKYMLNEFSAEHYKKVHEEFIQSATSNGIKITWIYELVRDALNLKPLDELVNEGLKKERHGN